MQATQLLHEMMLDDVVIGCRPGGDGYAFPGGFRMWDEVAG